MNISIRTVEIIKKVKEFEFNYTLSNSFIKFRYVDFFNKKEKNMAVEITIFSDLSIKHSINSNNKALMDVLFLENIYSNKAYLKIIADALLLNKKITIEVEDLILLNCDIDLKPYRNDSALINILENKFIDKKEKVRNRLLK